MRNCIPIPHVHSNALDDLDGYGLLRRVSKCQAGSLCTELTPCCSCCWAGRPAAAAFS